MKRKTWKDYRTNCSYEPKKHIPLQRCYFPLFWHVTIFNSDTTSALWFSTSLAKQWGQSDLTLKAQKAAEESRRGTKLQDYLFVMGDQLGLHMARHEIHSPQHLPCLQPPDGTSCINAGGTWKQPMRVSSWQERGSCASFSLCASSVQPRGPHATNTS